MPHIILGLGSNVGDSEDYLRRTVTVLHPLLESMRCSAVYSSPAMLPEDAPESWDKPFLNMAIAGNTSQSALAWLTRLKQLETTLGRQETGRWGPREIDIDLLAYGNEIIETDTLHIPHPGLLERQFVLKPVRDVAPDWHYPRPGIHQGKTIREIADLLKMHEETNCRKTAIIINSKA